MVFPLLFRHGIDNRFNLYQFPFINIKVLDFLSPWDHGKEDFQEGPYSAFF